MYVETDYEKPCGVTFTEQRAFNAYVDLHYLPSRLLSLLYGQALAQRS